MFPPHFPDEQVHPLMMLRPLSDITKALATCRRVA